MSGFRNARLGTLRWSSRVSGSLCVIRARSHLGRPTSLQEWRKIAATRVLDGERNTTLLRLAGHLIANPLLDPYVARELPLGWNRSMCEPPLPTLG